MVHQLIDDFTLFYFKFMQTNKLNDNRADKVINLCEMQFSHMAYPISLEQDYQLRHKEAQFIEASHTRCATNIIMITPHGVDHHSYWQHIQQEVTMDDLFT